MPEPGGLGRIVALLSETDGRNTRLGRVFVLLGALTFVGAGVLFALTGTLRLTAAEWWMYRVVAGTLLGGALPALLHGLVLLADTARPIEDTSDIGITVCVLAAGILLSTGADVAVGLYPALVIYGLGVLACASALGSALSEGDESTTTTPAHGINTSDEELSRPTEDMTASVEDPFAD